MNRNDHDHRYKTIKPTKQQKRIIGNKDTPLFFAGTFPAMNALAATL